MILCHVLFFTFRPQMCSPSYSYVSAKLEVSTAFLIRKGQTDRQKDT